MQREVNINKTRPQYLWILCCNKMTCTVFTSLRQNTTLSDVTRNTFNILKRYWPGPRLIFFTGQIWSKPMFLNLWLDTTIMELSPDNLKIFTGVLPPVLVLQKHPKKGSQTFSFKKMLEFLFFFFSLTLMLPYLPAVASVATISLSGWCSKSLTRLCKHAGVAQDHRAAHPGPQRRGRRNITRIPAGSDCFMNI